MPFTGNGNGSGSGTANSPTFGNVFEPQLDIRVGFDTVQVVVGQVLRDTMVQEVIDGELVWVLKTVVDKIVEDSLVQVLDTIGFATIAIPVVYRLCNVLSGFSDI